MFKKMRSQLLSLVAATLLLVPMITVSVYADSPVTIQDNVCDGANNLQLDNGDGGCAATSGSTSDFNRIIADVINIFSVIVGMAAVIMILVGGFRYITSGGDSNKIGSAKTTIIYAIIGLVIVAMAQVVVKFVLAKATNQGS